MSRLALIFEKQWLHVLALVLLFAMLRYSLGFDAVRSGELWGIGTPAWLWIAAGLAVLHQGWVWFCWRTELHASLLSRTFGPTGFTLYAVAFSVIGIARTVAVFLVAISGRDSFQSGAHAARVVAVVIMIPAIYLFYSVRRYFGFRRAFGFDHFDEDARSWPIVTEGIFRFTGNGMYTFGFLLLWAPALWFASAAGLVAAAFNHLYIWVHYFATERPDMLRIYGGGEDGRRV